MLSKFNQALGFREPRLDYLSLFGKEQVRTRGCDGIEHVRLRYIKYKLMYVILGDMKA